MISQKNIAEIFEAAKVEEVIGDYITLKKRGVNMIGLCPFHHEKTPSFTVSPAKNIYKCFGCGQGGNPVNFIMEHEGMSYPEALRHLAKRYNIQLDEIEFSDEQRQEKQLYDSLYLINDFAKQFFIDQLFDTDEGKSIGLSYFKERGFREDTIKKFELGYAPNNNAFNILATKTGYKEEMLVKAGLVRQGGRDFFRNRVQFPIHNLTGKVVGFGGRIMTNNPKAPKYLNTPESEIYNKSKLLYGAYFAKKAIRQFDECIMVEGYTDVISLQQSSIENVVASSGTSLTVEQISLIKRYTPNMKILYDGDPAGVKAALRGLDLVLEQDMNVKIVLLPDKEDPDSYLQKVGVTAFKEYINDKAQDFILFKTNLLMEEAKGDPVKTTNLIKDIVGSIAKIPDAIKRSLFIKQCAVQMSVSEELLVSETNKVKLTQDRQRRKQEEREQNRREQTRPDDHSFPTEEGYQATIPTVPAEKKKQSDDIFQEKAIIYLLIQFGDKLFDEERTVAHYVMSNIEDVVEEFKHPFYKELILLCRDRLKAKEPINEEFFKHHERPEISNLASTALATQYDYSKHWAETMMNPLQTQKKPEENYVKQTQNTVNLLKWRKVNRMLESLAKQIKEAQEADDLPLIMKLIKVQMKMKPMQQELSLILGTEGAIKK